MMHLSNNNQHSTPPYVVPPCDSRDCVPRAITQSVILVEHE